MISNVRTTSLLTGTPSLEPLFSVKHFPVFMGCTDGPQEDDVFADMEWDICKETGIIQLRNPLPLSLVYLNQHNDGTGKIWSAHYQAFAEFLQKFDPKHVLEIGGAHDNIAREYLEFNPQVTWTIVEPNPQEIKNSNVSVIEGWFDEHFPVDTSYDVVIHSHVLEHTYNPVSFIKHISNFLEIGKKHIFTFPHLEAMLRKKYTNCLNFEHTMFLTEALVDVLLAQCGFTILEKQYFGDDHSIFYATEKTSTPNEKLVFPNKYQEYKQLFLDFVSYHECLVVELNDQITSTSSEVFLFGAHIFSQYLLAFGLSSRPIVSILDNSKLKQGKRLYGTRFMVDSPGILVGKKNPIVILKAGPYNDEIKQGIIGGINGSVAFL